MTGPIKSVPDDTRHDGREQDEQLKAFHESAF
jgi:hypothetical protein